MDKQLHIVSFTVPYPVMHGGMVDLFYKLTALHKAGVVIHLHCFTENNKQPKELDKYCASVNYYRRKKGLAGLSFKIPYIVSSRINKELNKNLLKDNHPILLEGVHSTSILSDRRFASRKICLRLHNIEYIYYRQLYQSSKSLFKRLYYNFESRGLKRYEYNIARKFSCILTVSQQDRYNYKKKFHRRSCLFIPVFTGHSSVNSALGNGEYCLYHGNLSVPENEKAALWLIDKVFSLIKIKLVIAGRNPSAQLINRIKSSDHISLVANPSDEDMQQLIVNAQCHVLPSFNATGAKLKLINALYNGRHCIASKSCVAGSGLDELCTIANNALSFSNAVKHLFEVPFTQEDIERRETTLPSLFDNDKNAEEFIRKLW